MIDGITVYWQCDKCSYRKRQDYGPEKTNRPTIEAVPPGWQRVGLRLLCEECCPAR